MPRRVPLTPSAEQGREQQKRETPSSHWGSHYAEGSGNDGDSENENRFHLDCDRGRSSSLSRARAAPHNAARSSSRGPVERRASRSPTYTSARQALEPRLGLATTYRTLELLRATGLCTRCSRGWPPLYVRCRREHHHHLVCTSCGSVEETELCAAPSEAELPRGTASGRRARARHLRHLPELRVTPAVPLAGRDGPLHPRRRLRRAAAGADLTTAIALTAASSSRSRSSTSCRRRSRPSTTRSWSACSSAPASSSSSSPSARSSCTTATTPSRSTPTPRSARSARPGSRCTASSTGSARRVRARDRDRPARLRRRGRARLRGRPEHRRLRPAPVGGRARRDPLARDRRGRAARRARSSARCSVSEEGTRRPARRLRRLLPLHGRHRPAPARPRAPLRPARALTLAGFAAIFARQPRRRPLGAPPGAANSRKRSRAASSGPSCSSSP